MHRRTAAAGESFEVSFGTKARLAGVPFTLARTLARRAFKAPWGYGLEIDLDRAEFEGAALPTQGGLRVSFTPHAEDAALPELHAGDEVSVLTEAKLPQGFRDEGAFDRLVLKLCYCSRNILLPGDAEKAGRTRNSRRKPAGNTALRRIESWPSWWKRTPQHKSSSARSNRKSGIISVGEANPYGHPSPQLLERLEASGVHVLRTDRDGAVHVLTDGQQLEVSCFVAGPSVAKAASMLAKIPDQDQSSDKK